jgi:hypothetical protein
VRNANARKNKKGKRLEETGDVSSLGVEVDVVEARTGGEAGHGGHVANERVDERGAGGQADIADGQGEACLLVGSEVRLTSWNTLLGGVVRQRQSSLGHADRKGRVALAGVGCDLSLGVLAELDAVGTVHLLGDDVHLLLEAKVDIVQEVELGVILASLNDGVGKLNSSLTTTSPVVGGNSSIGSNLEGIVLDELELSRGVVRELVDSDDDLDAEFLGVLNVLAKVSAALLEEFEVLLGVDGVQRLAGCDGGSTTVHLQSTDGGNENDSVGLEARHAALDVAELCTSAKSHC